MLYFLSYLLPLFILLTTIALVVGLYGLLKGGKYSGNFSNKMMRMRIILQFIAIVIAMLVLYFVGSHPI